MQAVSHEEELLAAYRAGRQSTQHFSARLMPTLRPMCTSDLETKWEEDAERLLAQSLRGKRAAHLSRKLSSDPNLRFSPSFDEIKRTVGASLTANQATERRRNRRAHTADPALMVGSKSPPRERHQYVRAAPLVPIAAGTPARVTAVSTEHKKNFAVQRRTPFNKGPPHVRSNLHLRNAL